MSWLDFSESCETEAGSPVDRWSPSVPSSEAAYLNSVSDGSWHISFTREESRPGKKSSARRQSPGTSVLSALWKMTKRPSPVSPLTIPRQDEVYAGVSGFAEPNASLLASGAASIKFGGEESDWSSSGRYPSFPFGAECDIHLDTDNPVSYYAIRILEF
jgi:hypothetical protein